MIIDVHTHIFPAFIRDDRAGFVSRESAFAGIYRDSQARMVGAAELVRTMDEDGVDLAVTFGFPWSDRDLAKAHNDYLIEAQTRFPGRLIGLACFNPLAKWAPEEAERAVTSGLKGLGELAVYDSGFAEKDREAFAALGQICQSRDLPLLVHVNEPIGHHYQGKAPLTLNMIYSLVQALKGVKLILAHFGGGLFFYNLLKREVPEALEDVYFDTAASPFLYRPDIYGIAARVVGPEKILFGSDYPLIRPSRYFKEMESVDLDADTMEMIKGCAALQLLANVIKRDI